MEKTNCDLKVGCTRKRKEWEKFIVLAQRQQKSFKRFGGEKKNVLCLEGEI